MSATDLAGVAVFAAGVLSLSWLLFSELRDRAERRRNREIDTAIEIANNRIKGPDDDPDFLRELGK